MSSKIREALVEVESILSTWIDHLPPDIQEKAQEAIDKAEEALAEPLRNCDVGTAEEQAKRFEKLCGKQRCDCIGCPVNGRFNTSKCPLLWAQMPYETVKTNKGE